MINRNSQNIPDFGSQKNWFHVVCISSREETYRRHCILLEGGFFGIVRDITSSIYESIYSNNSESTSDESVITVQIL